HLLSRHHLRRPRPGHVHAQRRQRFRRHLHDAIRRDRPGLTAGGLSWTAAAAAGCAGDGPWVQLQLGAEGWSETQRAAVLSDLQHTLAGQGIAACSSDAHPSAAALATLTVDLSPEDKAKATVDIEVRDAVTHKRVR